MKHKLKKTYTLAAEILKARRAEFDTEKFQEICSEYNVDTIAVSDVELNTTSDLILKAFLNDLFLVKTKNNNKFYISNTELPLDMIKECIVRHGMIGEVFIIGLGWFEYKRAILFSYEVVEKLRKKYK